MNLTIKILLTGTFLLMIMRAWVATITVSTIGVMAQGRITRVQRDKMDALVDKSTAKSLGLSVWLTALATLVWVFL